MKEGENEDTRRVCAALASHRWRCPHVKSHYVITFLPLLTSASLLPQSSSHAWALPIVCPYLGAWNQYNYGDILEFESQHWLTSSILLRTVLPTC